MELLDNFLKQSQEGCANAAEVNELISELMDKTPITLETVYHWMVFIGVLQTTTNVIKTAIQREQNMAKHKLWDK